MANPFITTADPMQQIMIDPEAQALQRQKQYAAALLQNSQQPQGQMIGNRYVAPSWTQQLNSALNPVIGAYMMNKADTEQAKLAEAIRQQGEKDIQGYTQAVTGKPEQTVYGAGQEGPTMNVTPAVAPDFAGGLATLRASKDPENRALAKMLMAERLKSHVLPEGGTIVYGGLGGEGGTVTGAPKKTTEQRDYETAVGQGFKGSFLDYQTAIRNASANRTNVNVQNQLPFKEEVQKEAGKSLMTNFNTLQNIPVQIKQLDKVAELAPKSFAGSGAQAKLDAAKFLNNNLGLNVATDKVKNTEELNTILFTNIMENLKKMDASPSQQQQAEMKQGLGNIGTDPTALPKVVNIYKEILVDKAKEHNRRVGEVEKGGMTFPYDIKVNVPTTTETPTSNQGGWRLKYWLIKNIQL